MDKFLRTKCPPNQETRLMITKLTPSQWAALREYREELFRHNLSTERVDRKEFERLAGEMYRAMGVNLGAVRWASSLLEFQQNVTPKTPPIRPSKLFQHAVPLYCMSFELLTAIEDFLGMPLWNHITRTLHSNSKPSMAYQYCPFPNLMWWHLRRFDCNVLGITHTPEERQMIGLMRDIGKTAGWWSAFEGEVWAFERPTVISIKDESVLHRDDGPAVAFADGWKIWVLDGHTMDEQLVMRPQTQTLSDIGMERNAELKRIRIERCAGRDQPPVVGWMRYLWMIDAYCVGRRRNDVENVEEALFRTDKEEMVLICSCPSTARVYALEVPSSCRTVEQAQAYLHSQSKMDNIGPPNVIGRS